MNYSPVGIIIMSFFFAVIDIGAGAMEFSTGVSGRYLISYSQLSYF